MNSADHGPDRSSGQAGGSSHQSGRPIAASCDRASDEADHRRWPRITIVTPVRNMAQYIETTIDSVLSQGYPNLQYIIIDGASDDGTAEIIASHASSLHHWESSPDDGMYDALNRGFSHADGEIMGYINGDDQLHPKSLFYVAEQFRDAAVDWVEGYNTHIDVAGHTVRCHPQVFNRREDYLSAKYIKRRGRLRNFGFIQQESTFWRRSLWTRAGGQFDLRYRLAGDFDLWMRFYRHAKLTCVPGLIGAFRIRPDQASAAGMEQYLAEVESIRRREVMRLSGGEKMGHSLRLATAGKWQTAIADLVRRAA